MAEKREIKKKQIVNGVLYLYEVSVFVSWNGH